jgi:hypothetical protein
MITGGSCPSAKAIAAQHARKWCPAASTTASQTAAGPSAVTHSAAQMRSSVSRVRSSRADFSRRRRRKSASRTGLRSGARGPARGHRRHTPEPHMQAPALLLESQLADGARRRCDQPDQVGDPCPVDAGAGIVKADMAVAVLGEQDGVPESSRGSHPVDVGSTGVAPGADQQDRVLRLRIPGSPVVVLAAYRPGGARGPQPPAQQRAAEAVDLGEQQIFVGQLAPRARRGGWDRRAL